MADKFGLKLGLEGEKEFKSALSEINQSFKVLGSEMKLVQSQFDKNDSSVEALTARNTVLNKEIEAQKQKIETLRSALDNAAASFGENDRRTQNWQIQLNNAQAALNDMERELGENEKALEQTDQGMDDASDSAEGLGEHVKDVGRDADDASGRFEGLGNVCKAVAAAMAAAFAAAFAAVSAASIAAGKALVSMSREGAAYADTVLTESTVTGVAADKLQEYMYAAELVDVSVETLTGSMTRNIKSMSSAAEGSKSYASAYERLGVAVTDANGNLRDSDTVYWELIDALGSVENETERDALAMAVLGKSAKDLNPLIEAGADRLNELGAEARAAGYVISDDMLNAYGALDDQLQYLNVGAQAAKNALGTILLPLLTDLAGEGVDLLGQFTNGVLTADGNISKIADVISDILPQALDSVMKYVPQILSIIGAVLNSVGQAIVDNLPLIVDSAARIVFSILTGMIAALPQITQGAVQLILALVNGLMENLPLIVEAAVQMIATLASGIAEALPKLIPALVQTLTFVVQTLIDNMPLILDAALRLITGLAEGFLAAIPILIEALPNIISAIVGFLLGAVPEFIDTGVRLLTALVEALPEIITAVVAAIPQIVASLVTAILDSIPQLVDAGVQLLIALIQNLPLIITTVLTAIPQIISSLVAAIIGSIPQLVQAGVQLLTSLIKNLPQIITGIVTALSAGVSQVVGVGENLVRGLWQGIQSLAGWLWSKVSSWISSIWDGIMDFFGIHSPSRKMAWIGDMLVKGLAGSIEDNGGEAVRAAESMSEDVAGVLNGLAADMARTVAPEFNVNGGVAGVPDAYGAGAASPACGVSVYIDSLAVREEADINRIAQKLYDLERQALRKKGVVYA